MPSCTSCVMSLSHNHAGKASEHLNEAHVDLRIALLDPRSKHAVDVRSSKKASSYRSRQRTSSGPLSEFAYADTNLARNFYDRVQ
jgi:hypothetical protein